MTVGILGLGLIGGSLARVYAKAGATVLACDTDRSILEFAQLSGVVTDALTSENIPQCELILLAIYPGACIRWLVEHAGFISPDSLVLDCCGTKSDVCNACFPIAEAYGFTFVGAHPMAGSHNAGFKHSRSNLFQGAPVVLVPPRFDDIALLQRVKDALEPCHFGRFSVTTAETHDQMIAFTSQMPHIISNAFIKSPTALSHKGYSAGSYKDLTRVAWLNANMWAELCMNNRENVLKELSCFLENLQQYRDALVQGDTQQLTDLFAYGSQRKEQVDG